MDWYLDGDDPETVSLLRREVMTYLRRHGAAESDFDGAELVLAETVANAVRHAAGPSWVSLTWQEMQPLLTVSDLGPGFDPHRLEQGGRTGAGGSPRPQAPEDAPDEAAWDLLESGRGLFLIRELASGARAAVRAGGGMLVSVTLPVQRPASVSHDPPRRRWGALPDLSEARPEGAFGRESFLRALVVQLARSVELQHGPDAAESAVAQVGVDVGGQMEEEFRLAQDIVGRMSPEQMGQCYVRLKHAIEGDFYLIEVSEERIVLGNRRCPFGEVVRRAPSLCRMTSSVFGGIAARNSTHGASVLLEERIAIGDPGCRVVVLLDPPQGTDDTAAHRYASPPD